jgi:prostaglandin-endoperoxide synthase 2
VSTQAAGAICLENSPEYMLMAEYSALKMARDFRIRSFNEYREQFGQKRLKDFDELMDKGPLQDKLKTLYGNDINKVEFIVGLYAEKAPRKRLFGELMTTMVGYDAMTHIHTNPLLSKYIYNAATFTQAGLDVIQNTHTLDDLVRRNVPPGSKVHATFDYP